MLHRSPRAFSPKRPTSANLAWLCLTTLLVTTQFILPSLQATAQSLPTHPQAITVDPLPQFEVEVFVDKDPSGQARPSYRIGETIGIGVRVSEASYLYLFNREAGGRLEQILPNSFDASNFLQAGETRFFPVPGAPYTFQVDGPQGLEKVIAVASRQPLDTSTLGNLGADTDFAAGNSVGADFAGTLGIVVQPLPRQDWVSDSAFFMVGTDTPPRTPTTALLDIRSSPKGAEIFIDGRLVGMTPLRLVTSPGRHRVRVEHAGFRPFQKSVKLESDQHKTITARLERVSNHHGDDHHGDDHHDH